MWIINMESGQGREANAYISLTSRSYLVCEGRIQVVAEGSGSAVLFVATVESTLLWFGELLSSFQTSSAILSAGPCTTYISEVDVYVCIVRSHLRNMRCVDRGC